VPLSCDESKGACYKTHCDESWACDKVFHVYCNDTSYTTKFSDVYYTKQELKDKGNDWEVYYDEELMIKMADFILRDDTAYHLQYYKNGRKKLESKTLAQYGYIKQNGAKMGN
jgi:hypothetical protein